MVGSAGPTVVARSRDDRVRKGASPVRTRPFATGRQWLDNAPYVDAQRLPDLNKEIDSRLVPVVPWMAGMP
jgi:hypothetical protein